MQGLLQAVHAAKQHIRIIATELCLQGLERPPPHVAGLQAEAAATPHTKQALDRVKEILRAHLGRHGVYPVTSSMLLVRRRSVSEQAVGL